MPSQIILDMKDPGVAELAAGWTDGESYPIPSGTMTQVSKDESRVILDVTEIVAPETSETAEVETQAPAKPKKPAVSVEY